MKKAIILAVMLAIHAASSYAQTSSDEQTCDTIAIDTVAVDTIAATPIAAPDSSFVAMQAKRDFLRKVYDHAVYMQNISARIDLGISGLGHDITLDGKLQMRRNKVIRITITPFGLMEAARLEFTPSYVLLIDRIHKEYVKASYSDVAFLKAEGLTFYTLQSLFWNELFQPGKAKLSDSDLSTFSLSDAAGGNHLVDLLDNRLKFRWTTNSYAYITNTNITYDKGTKNESSVNVASPSTPRRSPLAPCRSTSAWAPSAPMPTGRLSLPFPTATGRYRQKSSSHASAKCNTPNYTILIP